MTTDLLVTKYKILIEKTEYETTSSLDFLYRCVLEIKPEIVVEHGTQFLCSSLFMAEAMRENGKGKIFTIDNYECDDKYSLELSNKTITEFGFGDIITAIQGNVHDSHIILASRFSNKADLVFLDAGHTTPELRLEMESVSKFISDKTVILIDDIDYQVGNSAREFYEEIEFKYKKEVPYHNGIGIVSNTPISEGIN